MQGSALYYDYASNRCLSVAIQASNPERLLARARERNSAELQLWKIFVSRHGLLIWDWIRGWTNE